MTTMIDAHRLHELAARGLTHRQMAEELGCHYDSVRRQCGRLGIPRKAQREGAARRSRVEDLARLGWGTGRIAAEVGLSKDRVRRLRKDAGLATPAVRAPDPEAVVRLAAAGVSVREGALRLGCSERALSRARRRLGVAKPLLRKHTPEEIAQAEAMLADGCSVKEISETLGRDMTRHFYGRGWTNRQAAQHAAVVRNARRQLRLATVVA